MEQIVDEEAPVVPDVRKVVDRGSAPVHSDEWGVERLERLEGPGECVVKAERHDVGR